MFVPCVILSTDTPCPLFFTPYLRLFYLRTDVCTYLLYPETPRLLGHVVLDFLHHLGWYTKILV